MKGEYNYYFKIQCIPNPRKFLKTKKIMYTHFTEKRRTNCETYIFET